MRIWCTKFIYIYIYVCRVVSFGFDGYEVCFHICTVVFIFCFCIALLFRKFLLHRYYLFIMYKYISNYALGVFIATLKKGMYTAKKINRSHTSKNRQYNGQNKKDKRTNKDLQNAIASHHISYRYSCKLW